MHEQDDLNSELHSRVSSGGHLYFVRNLLDRGADPNALDSRMRSPLDVATNANDVRLLLQRGADPNKPGTLHGACLSGNVEKMRALLEAGADPEVTDSRGWTPAHLASSMNNTRVLKMMAEMGKLDLTLRTPEGYRVWNMPRDFDCEYRGYTVGQLLALPGGFRYGRHHNREGKTTKPPRNTRTLRDM